MTGNRRRLLKALTIGGGAVTAARLPGTWTQPVVESVVLPAHAQTTAGAPLSGNAMLDPVMGLDGGSRFRDFVDREVFDRFLPAAHAEEIPDRPPPSETRLFAYAARETAMGSGWWRVQVLLSIEFFDRTQFLEHDRQTLPGSFVAPAYAVEPEPESCRFERVYETVLQVQAGGASSAGNAPVSDGCGEFEGPPDNIIVQLLAFNDPNLATQGIVRADFTGEGPPPVNIPVVPGGGPLFADCGAMACEEPEQ